jgi:cytosine/creatinine deaminase
MDLLIHNVRVWDDQPLMDIGIEDGKFTAIEERIEGSAVESIDAGGRVVMAEFPSAMSPAWAHLPRRSSSR